jgi:hypothetical protein
MLINDSRKKMYYYYSVSELFMVLITKLANSETFIGTPVTIPKAEAGMTKMC